MTNGLMDYAAYFRDLGNYYNDSRVPSRVMTGVAKLRAEFNQTGSWVWECAESLQATLAKRRVLESPAGRGDGHNLPPMSLSALSPLIPVHDCSITVAVSIYQIPSR
jgi:hypothetical protein